MSSHKKRPLEAVAPGRPEPEQEEAARSPRKRLRRTVLVMMWLERGRRARAATVDQMAQVARQMQFDMAKLFFLLMMAVARLTSVERVLVDLPSLIQGLLAEQLVTLLPNMLRGLLADQLGTFQRSLMGSIQDRIRPTVRTEMQERQSALLPNGVHEPTRQILESSPVTGGITTVKLRFVDVDKPNDPLFAGYPVQWQNGDTAKVAIFENDRKIMQGDLSKLQIEILLVHADFFTERGEADFTKEEFNKHICTYNGKESVLTTVNLTNGQASIGSFIFTESSYRKKLRLTARVKRQDLAVRVQEAITDPFIVKDRRSKSNQKSYPPSKDEPVHHLERISRKGKHCHDLASKNITTVKHLMRHYHRDKSGLQKLLDMKDDWSTLIKHAITSDPGVEVYSYRIAEENTELLFNDFYDLIGMMSDGFYFPVKNLDHFWQLKANNWKMSAYNNFDERENSGGLTPDYFMINDNPTRAVPLNNEAGPSVQPRSTWHYPNEMAAQQEFGEQHPFRQQNGFSPAEVLSNNDAGPSKQEVPLFSQNTAHQDLGQHGPSLPQNGTPYCHLIQGNMLNGNGSSSAQPDIPSYPLVQEHNLAAGARLTAQHNLCLSSSRTDVPGTSFPVADGASLRTSSLHDVQTDDLSWFPQLEEWLATEPHGADQLGFATSNELPNSNNQFDGGNQ